VFSAFKERFCSGAANPRQNDGKNREDNHHDGKDQGGFGGHGVTPVNERF
jgi:hypothetical protein